MSQTPPDYPCPRNPRIHRQSGIPSISRPRGGAPSPNPNDNDHHKSYSNSPRFIEDMATPKISSNNHPNTGKTNVAGKMSKIVGFQFLSKTRGGGGDGQHEHHDALSDKLSVPEDPISSSSPFPSSQNTSRHRRVASMPPLPPTTPHPPSHAHLQTQMDIDNDRLARRGIGLASPPIVDFTRFEDMYRSPRNGTFEGLLSHRTPKPKPKTGLGVEGGGGGANARGVKNRSSTTGVGVRPVLKTETPVMLNRRSTTGHLSVPGGGNGMAPPHPASERKPDPRLVVCAAVDILGSKRTVEEYLNSHELLAAHQLDQLDFEERDAVHAGFIESGKLKVKGRRGALVVLGQPIRRATLYSSTTMVLGGRDHILPILVVNCVEELYRTGIYQPQLFRSLPNRARLLELIAIFDSEHAVPGSIIRSRQTQSAHSHTILIPNAGFGTNTSLHLESTPDICALLTTYLSSLGEPILPPFLFRAVWDWCRLDDVDDDDDVDVDGDRDPDGGNNHDHDQNHKKTKPSLHSSSSFSRRPGLPSPIPLSRTYTSPSESTHILLAQLLLHLMPSPNFSLLIYLLAFFSQVALVREENGVGVEDLSRMFGGRIFGGGSIPSSTSTSASTSASASASAFIQNSGAPAPGISESRSGNSDIFNTTQTRREGETMMSWFLRRWGPISEGLFDVVDDAKMGLFRRTLARKDSFGKDVLSGWVSGASPAKGVRDDDCDDDEEVQKRDVYQDEKHVGRGGLDSMEEEAELAAAVSPRTHMQPIPTIRLDMAPQGHSTPKSKTTDSWMRAVRSQSRYEEDENENEHEEKEKGYYTRPREDEEVDIVDDYVVVGPSGGTTPTPTPATVMRSNPLEMDDTLDIARIPATSSSGRSYMVSEGISPGDERLMDISMPTFLNQTLPGIIQHTAPDRRKARSISPQATSRSRSYRSFGVQTKTLLSPSDQYHQHPEQQQQQQLTQALRSVSHLERQLRNCTDLVSDTLKELDVSRRESYARAHRILELERVLAGSSVGLMKLDEDVGGHAKTDLDGISTGFSKGKGKERKGQTDSVTFEGVHSQRN